MSSTGQKKKGDTPPARAARTPYTILVPIPDVGLDDRPVTLWKIAESGNIDAHGAHDAIRRWANRQGDGWAGGQVMAVPARSLTIVDVKVETKRQLTLGAPGS